MRADTLFYERTLDDVLHSVVKGIPQKVDKVPKEQFVASTDDQLVEHFLSELAVEPLELFEQHAEMDQVEVSIDVSGDTDRYWSYDFGPREVPGTKVTVSIPFTGDEALWRLRPNPCRMSFPHGQIKPASGKGLPSLLLTFAKPHDTPEEEFKRELENQLDDIRHHIQVQNLQIEKFNKELPEYITNALGARRQRLAKHQGLTDLLNIPLKRREGAPPIDPIRIEKKVTKPLPSVPKAGWKPEPGITSELYEQILTIIRHEGRTFETTPKTYKVHDEEELRDIMLAHLNGHYRGGATGETFRKSGKTDIRIEDENRAAFIAECKVWRGKKELNVAVDQLLSYLTWRDCKAALIIFNKNVASFSTLLPKVPGVLSGHPLLLKELGGKSEGEWRYAFRSQEDENRQITVHIFLFNIYA